MSVTEFLRKVPLFADLPERDLARICQIAEEVHLQPGQTLFREGEPGPSAYVIRRGAVEILKASDGREVLLAVRQDGDVIGEMSLLEDSPRMATVRARTEAVLIRISQEQLDALLERSPSAAQALLRTVVGRWRATEVQLRQSEKMAQLGTMAAGLAHELNNPAAAVQRGAQQMVEADARRLEAEAALVRLGITEQERAAMGASLTEIRARTDTTTDLAPLERSDREAELEAWLESSGAEDAWELAPLLASGGWRASDLDALGRQIDRVRLAAAARSIARQHAFLALLEEIQVGASRLSELVLALKRYTYLDQAPVQEVDVHEGLDSTLVILRSKLKHGVRVTREYAADLPRITAYGSELNQVWTNLIDNAVDAMNGQGDLTLRTAVTEAGRWIAVEVIDSGPGIPDGIKDRIFDPFFTTKPPGKGTGLGLDISYSIVVNRHRGEISASSRPGRTVFQVKLPVRPEAATTSPAGGSPRPTDETLRRILETTRTIAVLGASPRRESPANVAPAHLKARGYRLLPVSTRGDEILGEKTHPDLASLPEAPDVVLVIRRGDGVVPIVNAAVARGARVVWMQEGVIDEPAAAAARQAGLEVVMDTCMSMTYKRLMESGSPDPKHGIGSGT